MNRREMLTIEEPNISVSHWGLGLLAASFYSLERMSRNESSGPKFYYLDSPRPSYFLTCIR